MKFKMYDTVLYKGTKKASVMGGWVGANKEARYRIKLVNESNKIEEARESDLIEFVEKKAPKEEYVYKNGYVDSTKYCPICYSKWHKSYFGNKEWNDCKKCKKTKEEILND
jgi:hypothetical protein